MTTVPIDLRLCSSIANEWAINGYASANRLLLMPNGQVNSL